MKRRTLLAGLLAAPVVTYFDMGASWKKHGDLYVFDGIDRSVHPDSVFDYQGVWTPDAERILKEYYNDRVVRSLTYEGNPPRSLTLPRSGFYP
jgi:(2Fe-2S) ferredoxin